MFAPLLPRVSKPPIAPFGRSAPKNPVNPGSLLFFFLSFLFLFYSLGLSSEDLGSLGELRVSEAFRELWAVSVKFLLSALRGFSKNAR